MHNTGTLQPPRDVSLLEMHWYSVSPLEKPFSINYEVEDGETAWHDSDNHQWLDFLKAHPQAINSLDIMDDITTLVYMYPNNDQINRIKPLTERAERIIHQAGIPANRVLPWDMQENRAALRLLSHSINPGLIFARPVKILKS